MNKALRQLYVAVVDNKVVAYGTNLSGFIKELVAIEPNCRNRAYFDREFDKSDTVTWTNNEGCVYTLQKLK